MGILFRIGMCFVGGLFCFALAGVMIQNIYINEECEVDRILKLKAWNGLTDTDTGLFSSGSVDRDTFLFENGEVIDYRRLEKVIIGHYYQVSTCTAFMWLGDTYTKLEYVGSG